MGFYGQVAVDAALYASSVNLPADGCWNYMLYQHNVKLNQHKVTIKHCPRTAFLALAYHNYIRGVNPYAFHYKMTKFGVRALLVWQHLHPAQPNTTYSKKDFMNMWRYLHNGLYDQCVVDVLFSLYRANLLK